MTMAQDLNFRFNLEETLFRLWQSVFALKKVSCEGLQVTAAKTASWYKRVRFDGTCGHL